MKRYCVEAKLRLKQLQCSLDFIQQNYQNNKMGALCCCDLFQKNEIQTNQSRLRLLQMKVQSQYSTENDHHFTYYLHYFEQHAYLEKILLQYRSVNQITQDSSCYQFNSKKLQVQIENLTHYLQDIQNSQSQISKRMRADQAKILQEAQMQSQSGPKEQFCMVKLQIQGYQIVQGITKISIEKSTKIKKQQKNTEEVIVMCQTKNEKIYRELIFPIVKGSKIKIVTVPKSSKITIDVEDIMKNQAVCNVFKLQNNDQDFGYVALRMQYFTVSPLFNKLRNEKMKVLQKELKLCAQGPEGVHRLSSRSHASSHVNTIISDHVSDYHNQYHM